MLEIIWSLAIAGLFVLYGGYVLVNIFCSLWINKNKPCIFTSTSTDKSTRLFLYCFATKNPKVTVKQMIDQHRCDEWVPMIRILLFSSGFVIGQWIYLWWLAQNAKILSRGSCFASRGCATFSILLCKILPRLVCGTPLLLPMFRSSKLEK